MKSLKGRVAAITGAGSGIGQALAIELAKEGCHLALSDIVEERLAETEELVSSYDVQVTTSVVDVADREAVFEWAEQTQLAHGRVNLIFNNAGVAVGATVEGITFEDFEWLMNINFWGVVNGTKAFLPLLKKTGDGHVVNISSLFGIVGIPMQSAYNASKFAVRGFTESLRTELDIQDYGVSATCVHPGGISTRIADDGRISGDRKHQLASDPEAYQEEFSKKALTMPPEKAARIILSAVKKDKRRVLVGNDAKALTALQTLLPTGYQRIIGAVTKRNLSDS
jgi:NAD(P)-dependent dehydrogenase (short-subunit alcohol dehydrogenase family)